MPGRRIIATVDARHTASESDMRLLYAPSFAVDPETPTSTFYSIAQAFSETMNRCKDNAMTRQAEYRRRSCAEESLPTACSDKELHATPAILNEFVTTERGG